jgi:glycosyltransferase involved in cell wall biosynthesis
MRLAFYHHGIPFDGNTVRTEPLGGSESGIIYMARELQRSGHDVTVYANCPKPGNYENVVYSHYHEFFNVFPGMPWDAVISFRSFDPFLLGRIAPRMIYWTGDAFNQPFLTNFGHSILQQNIDAIFCVSEWHRRTFIDAFDLPPEKVIATRNGFSPDIAPAGPGDTKITQRCWSRAAYSSTPFRGLDILLKLFPKLRSALSDLSLDVFSSMKVYGWSSEADRHEYGALYALANQPGVTWHGSVPQPQLLRHLSQTGLFLYPNTFDETSCIAAIEAQASGCVVVTSAKAGLNETVEHGKTGICLEGDPKSPDYQHEFVSVVRSLLENPEELYRLSAAAQARAYRLYAWATIAAEWNDILAILPARPVHSRLSGPLTLLQKSHAYLANGNTSAATRVLKELERMPFLRNEVENLKGKLNTWM